MAPRRGPLDGRLLYSGVGPTPGPHADIIITMETPDD